MCEQCLAQAKSIKAEVLPGFSLMQATVGSENWPAGWYGLVECNDPMLVFPGPLAKEPPAAAVYSDDDDAAYTAFSEAVERLKAQLLLPAMDGYLLIQACSEAGYRINVDGEPAFWLMNHLANQVEPQAAKEA